MYNSSYSKATLGLAAKKMHRSKSKSCGYYMKTVFFFSSLIQSLIIVSLVLFLVYGQPEHTMEEKRLQELDNSISNLTMENYVLRQKQKNLTKHLNVTLTAKLIDDKNLFELRKLANTSFTVIRNLQIKLNQYEMDKRIPPPPPHSILPVLCPDPSENNRQLRLMLRQSEDMLKLVKTNFTQLMDYMKRELGNSNKEKDQFHLETIELRKDKAYLQEELDLYQKKCKEDFVASLQGIPNITKEFLQRIDDLFSKHVSFQLTCDKQKQQLENIQENCSSLSREVENKLQSYLDFVGNQFTKINGENSKYITENKRFREDADWCNQNRSAMIRENLKTLERIQLKHDQDMKRQLMENKKLQGEKQLKEDLLSVKEKEINMLTHTIETLNASCKPALRNPFGQNPFSLPNIPNAGGTGLGSIGLNKPNIGWPGTGSTGPGFPSQYGAGSSSRWGGLGTGLTGYGSLGSSGTATGNMGSVGTGSTPFSSAGPNGVGVSKPGVAGVGVGPVGSHIPPVGGTGRTTSGIDSQLISQAQISQLLKDLHRNSVPI